ncbi:MAG: hypothetical protein WAU56_03795 [Steroidobacteraceae bacterium]
MRLITLSCAAVLVGCANAPAPDDPSAPARAQQRTEARELEQAEAACAKQGKHAVAARAEGETIYNCE